MEDLNPQVKRKIRSDNPRRFYGHHSLTKRHQCLWEATEQVFRFATGPATIRQHLSALDSNVKSKDVIASMRQAFKVRFEDCPASQQRPQFPFPGIVGRLTRLAGRGSFKWTKILV